MRVPALEIYTDGSAKNGRGAWAFVIIENGQILQERAAAVRKTASNFMEFRAAIEALKALEEGCVATLYSDSRILIDSMTLWVSTGKRPLALSAEVAQLDQLQEKHQITWKWIRAHAGHEFNERCDWLCQQARESL